MKLPEDWPDRWFVAYHAAVLGISAALIVGVSVLLVRTFERAVDQPGSFTLGVSALGQVLGAAAPHGPAAGDLPGLAGTPTASATPSATPTPTASATPTATLTATATLTPDVRYYDASRAKTLLAQAQTSFGQESTAFLPNLTLAAGRLNQQRLAPGETLSFNVLVGPYSTSNGYRPVVETRAISFGNVPTVEGGITQVSTTLFQAAFWSGLQIAERHTHPAWQDRFAAGSTAQKGLDAYVDATNDLRIENNTGDWIRIETSVQQSSLTISIYGADPGWSVNPTVGQPSQLVQPPTAPVQQVDPNLPPGQQFALSSGAVGFDVVVQRTVVKGTDVVDRYGVSEHYAAKAPVIAVGPSPTPTITPIPLPTLPPLPTFGLPPTPAGEPGHPGGFNPSVYLLPDGRVRVPNLVGLPEADAQQEIQAVGLTTTFVNYQGPNDVSPAVLDRVKVGEVLSQTPAADSIVSRGTTIFLAVRKA